MKLRVMSGAAALAAIAISCPAASASRVAQGHGASAPIGAMDFAIRPLDPGTYEATVTGRRLAGRDAAEAYLLYRTASFVAERGARWLSLLHLPGEGGNADHPVVREPGFGAAYAHWQPHWQYHLPDVGWQPWHPEWKAPFWADDPEARSADGFQVHAEIVLLRSAKPVGHALVFDAARIRRDLGPRFRARASGR